MPMRLSREQVSNLFVEWRGLILMIINQPHCFYLTLPFTVSILMFFPKFKVAVNIVLHSFQLMHSVMHKFLRSYYFYFNFFFLINIFISRLVTKKLMNWENEQGQRLVSTYINLRTLFIYNFYYLTSELKSKNYLSNYI